MINNKNNLDKLFEGLKQEKPLLSANEIQQIILNIEQNEIKSIKKNKIMTQSIFSFITLVVISTTLILFNNNPSNTENLSNQTALLLTRKTIPFLAKSAQRSVAVRVIFLFVVFRAIAF